jgi:hypothetical protein
MRSNRDELAQLWTRLVPSGIVAEGDFSHYIAGLEILLGHVEERLTPAQAERIRIAVRHRHESAKVREFLHDTAAEELGARIIAANVQLSSDEVARLEKFVLTRLSTAS